MGRQYPQPIGQSSVALSFAPSHLPRGPSQRAVLVFGPSLRSWNHQDTDVRTAIAD